MPNISVVITTFNRSAFVPRAIESVLAQTFKDFEIIVVDDGSTDDTREILEQYTGRIRYLYQPNKGVSAARNTGFRAARAEWVAILDSDDAWAPAKLESQMKAIAVLGDDFGVCFTDCRFVGDPAITNTSFEEAGLSSSTEFGPLENPLHFMTGDRYAVCIQSVLVRRPLLEEIGGFDENLGIAEDRDLIYRLSLRTKFCFVAAALVNIDRTTSVSRLTDWCSKRNDCVFAWNELVRRKLLAQPELVAPEICEETQNDLIDLYYNWAASRVQDFDFASTWRHVRRIREMGPGYATILRVMAGRALVKARRSLAGQSHGRSGTMANRRNT